MIKMSIFAAVAIDELKKKNRVSEFDGDSIVYKLKKQIIYTILKD